MKSIIITAIIWALLISGCTAQNQNIMEYAPDIERVTSDPDLEQAASAPTADFMFEASITDYLPMFTFAVYENEAGNKDSFQYTYDVRISCPALSDYIPQSIKISSFVKWKEESREYYIDLVDIDFDGFADIQAATSQGIVNVNYTYYRWSVFVEHGYGEFEEKPFFEMLTIGYELYSDTKQIISMTRDGAVNHPRVMYQLENTRNGGWLGEYNMLRREEQELIQSENGEDKITVRVFFADEEIYTETVTLDGDRYDTSGISDNYLRFGTGNPIDIETAVRLLYQKYGNADSGTGFRHSFRFEEMFLHEKLSCYKFRMQWLVDENHWSTLDFIGVTPDGRVINPNE